MKKTLSVALAVTFVALSQAGAAISAGDLAFIGANCSTTDGLGILVLRDLALNDTFTITDNGWLAAGGFRTGEGTLVYTAPGAVAAGTVLTWTNGQNITGTGWSSNNPSNFALNASGDSLIILTGTIASPTLIDALGLGTTGYTAGWSADAISASTSAAPTAANHGTLVTGTSIIGFNFPNGYYSGSITSGTQSELLAAVSNASNWTTSSTITATSSWKSSFTVTAVPEPHEYGIAFGGLLIALIVMRRRKTAMAA